MSQKHHGSSLDSLLDEEGVFEAMQTLAIEKVVDWQRTEAMEKQSFDKAGSAALSMSKVGRSPAKR
jgi:antitoxin HicB